VTNNIKHNISNDRLPDNMQGKIFKPQFIPIWTDVRDNYELNLRDCQMYGFIRFYIESTGNEFYFEDDDLKTILAMKSRTQIWESITNLKSKKLIKVRNTTKVEDKKIIKNRFISLLPLPMFGNTNIAMFGKPNINNNNNNINKEKTKKTSGQVNIDYKLYSDTLNDKPESDGLPMYW
jgi:hypothetical protein